MSLPTNNTVFEHSVLTYPTRSRSWMHRLESTSGWNRRGNAVTTSVNSHRQTRHQLRSSREPERSLPEPQTYHYTTTTRPRHSLQFPDTPLTLTLTGTCTSTSTSICTTSAAKTETRDPPRQRIAHGIDRALRTPQTDVLVPVGDVEELDRRARPQAVAAAVVLRVLGEDEPPQHGHVPA